MSSVTMEAIQQQPADTPVNQMFNGRSLFITGATGFIGRVLIEKLLRTYPGIDKIYLLMREKKNVSPSERLRKHLLDIPIFDQIKSMKNGQQLLDKLKLVTGDIGKPNLGIGEHDMQTLLADETLSIVFHGAAAVKFNEPLRVAVKYNLCGTQKVIDFCKRLKNLVALCHLSTAYVNSDVKDGSLIEEKLYPMEHEPHKLMHLVSVSDEQVLQRIEPVMVGERPNTYTYTKALAEHLVAAEATNLPVAIVRPSIVTAAWREPLSGWIDNLNGPTGLMVAFGKGVLRSLYVPNKSGKIDCIPVDVVVNMTIAAAYYAFKTNNKLHSTGAAAAPAAPAAADQDKTVAPKEEIRCATVKVPPIFHCTSGQVNPLRWRDMEDMFPLTQKHPSERVLRYPAGSFKTSWLHDKVSRLFAHYLPALIVDIICMIAGREPRLLSTYYRMHRTIALLRHFSTIEYNFDSRNTQLLDSCLIGKDRQQLYVDARQLVWTDYGENAVLGTRRHILKEPDSSLEAARKSLAWAYYIEWGLYILLAGLGFYFIAPLWVRVAIGMLTVMVR